MRILGKQVAAARVLLGWTQGHLAEAADLGEQAIARWELGQTNPHQSTVARVVKVIEDAGVEFTNGGAPGVRFKPKPGATEHERAGE